MQTIRYYVQALVDGENRVVSDENDQPFKFIERKQCLKFLKEEKEYAPKIQFRIVKHTEKFNYGEWT